MFTLTELLVSKDDNLQDLIETRARFFYSETGTVPTHAFVSIAVMRQLFMNSIGQIPGKGLNGFTQLEFYSSVGYIDIEPIKELKDFLMVGEAHSYREYYNNADVPEILWTDCSRQKINAEFEKEVLA